MNIKSFKCYVINKKVKFFFHKIFAKNIFSEKN